MVPVRCPYARLGVAYYRGRFVQWTLRRGASIPTWRKPRNCADAKYLAGVWAKRSTLARKSFHRWKIQQRTLRNHNTWLEAVREAQKAYPGTEVWLLSCSASEGSHGHWVRYGGGGYVSGYQGVGGWMQMLPSTYNTMMHGYYLPAHGRSYEGAWKDIKRRGFIVPRAVDSWFSPLGQALASAYGKLNGRGGEWHGPGC